jgi:hypothetical protein
MSLRDLSLSDWTPWPEELTKQGVNSRYIQWSITDFVEQQTSSPRRTYVPTTLMEVDAQEVEPRGDSVLLDRHDPEYEKHRHPHDDKLFGEDPGRRVTARSGNATEPIHIIERDENGDFRIWRRAPTTIRSVEQQLALSGMRLATCDEWEHACGAGADTLFRWGDDSPSDYYPDDTCAEDRELKRASTLSLRRLRYETPPPGWDLHDRPNLFGLRIASNPYRMDLVSEDPWMLGGNGGSYICGGNGFFLGWLPLATAFRDSYRDTRFRPDTHDVTSGYHRVRRVIPLS